MLAIRHGNRMNESVKAAGFSDGEASINASAGAIFRVRLYTAGKTVATQQEHSISGTPVKAAAS
jgi:hypothetical protein